MRCHMNNTKCKRMISLSPRVAASATVLRMIPIPVSSHSSLTMSLRQEGLIKRNSKSAKTLVKN